MNNYIFLQVLYCVRQCIQVGMYGIVYFGVGHTISHHNHVIMSWGFVSLGVQGRRDFIALQARVTITIRKQAFVM